MPKKPIFMHDGAILPAMGHLAKLDQPFFKCSACGCTCIPQNGTHPKYLECETCESTYVIRPYLYKVVRVDA